MRWFSKSCANTALALFYCFRIIRHMPAFQALTPCSMWQNLYPVCQLLFVVKYNFNNVFLSVYSGFKEDGSSGAIGLVHIKK